jgi:hypothetical protein
MPQMIEKCTDILAQRHIMSADQARLLMQKLIPLLKRWAINSAGHPQATTHATDN